MVNYVFLSVYFYSVPNLRFREFNEQLVYTSFGHVMKLYRGSSPRPIINYVTTDKSGLNWIKIGDMPSTGNRVFFCKERINKEGSKKSRAVYKGDIILSNSMSFGKPYILEIDGFIHDGWFVIRDYQNYIDKTYLCQLLSSDAVQKQYKSTAAGGVVKNISSDLVNSVKFHLPSIMEQRKIARFLELIDQKIEVQIKIIDTLSSQKKQIRNLLFKDIHKNANCCIQDYVIYEQPQKYIVHSTDYLSYGKDYTPVLTANQSFILGYTLEKDGIYEKGDCIIFDDFTNENKYVDFPFKVKSSALKILQTKEGLMLKFFYEYLQFLNFESTDHKRHYLSEVAVTDISVPNLKEQTFVCKIFTSFDNKLRNEKALLEKYRLQKQFLLNNLFI